MATLSKNGIKNAMSLMYRMRAPGFYEGIVEEEGIPQKFLTSFMQHFKDASPVGQRDPGHGYKTTSERMEKTRGAPWGETISGGWHGDVIGGEWDGEAGTVDSIRIQIRNLAPHFWAIAGEGGTKAHRIPRSGDKLDARGGPGLKFTWDDYPGRVRPPGSPVWGPKGKHESEPGFKTLFWVKHPGAVQNPFFYDVIKHLRPMLASEHKQALKDRLIQLFRDYGFKKVRS
jgi:hypothetical protein